MSALAILTSLALLAICSVCRPTSAHCPPGMDLRTGIRLDGHYQCWSHPVGDPEWDGTWQRPERSVQGSWVLEGRIYCARNTRPVVEDWQRVGCR